MPSPPVFGIGPLDAVLTPALPAGWLGLLEGAAGSGSSLLAKQFAAASPAKLPVFYYSAYERPETVLGIFRERGWPVEGLTVVNLAEEYFDRVLRRDLEVSRTRERGLTVSDLLGPQPPPVRRRFYNLESRMLADLAGIESPFRLVLDSLDFLLEVLPAADVMVVARQARHLCQELGGQVLLVVQSDVHERRLQGYLEDLADLVVELRSELTPGGPAHQIGVRKVRNHPELAQLMEVRATTKGLTIGGAEGRAP